MREVVERSLSHAAADEVREISLLQEHLREDVAAFVYERLRRRPMILPVVVEV
jgi:ribonuclease J